MYAFPFLKENMKIFTTRIHTKYIIGSPVPSVIQSCYKIYPYYDQGAAILNGRSTL